VRRLFLWGPPVILMGLIFYLSSLPDPGRLPRGISDKSAHFWAYAALGALWLRALVGGRAVQVTLQRFLLASFATALYGASDEIHQRFVPGRSPELLDVIADSVGAVIGALLAALAYRSKRGAEGT
jgi:VanZ family protein